MADETLRALTAARLKDKQRRLRDDFERGFGLRVHRAISWLQGAERAADDGDLAFICYWIAFNAAYVQHADLHSEHAESEFFRWYFKKIVALDANEVIYDAIWQRFSGSIRSLVDNRYVFAPFWRFQHGEAGVADWRRPFRAQRRAALRALGRQDTERVLEILFNRLYVLRNQLMHGGATWQSGVNRQQVRDGARIMAFLVPHFVDVMMDHPDEGWGEPPYPVVDEQLHSPWVRRVPRKT